MVVAWYFYAHGDEFLLLLEFDMRYLPLMLLIPLAAIAVNGLIMRLLVLQFDVRLSFQEWYGLTALQAFGNYVPFPYAGAVVRGIYLKKVHGLDYNSFTATVVVTHLQFVATVGFLGILTLPVVAAPIGHVPWPLWILFLTLGMIAVFLTPGPWSLPLIRRWRPFIAGLNTLRRRHVFLGVAVKQVIMILIGTIGIWLAFNSMGRPVPWSASLLLALVTMASGIINITPGNLGVAESAAWITAYLIHADADEAVVAYTLVRMVAIATVFGLAPYYILRLSADQKSDAIKVHPT